MRKKTSCWSRLANTFAYIAVSVSILFSSSCNNTNPPVATYAYDTTVKNWINWNILFDQYSDPQSRGADLQKIEKFLTDSMAILDSNLASLRTHDATAVFSFVFRLDSCSCDRTLYNLTGDLRIQGSGNSQGTIPPPTYPPIKPGGELAIINDNENLSKQKNAGPFSTITKRVSLEVKEVDTSRLLAIIDSGIDTTRFDSKGLQKILWKGTGLNPSQRNFTGTGNLSDFADDDQVLHGTAVAGLALQFFKGKYPQLMILKILDNTGSTTVFASTCALIYAIQHKADVINASWGYYGKPDLVMKGTIDRARRNAPSTLIIAAAGNDTLSHSPDSLCYTKKINGRNNELRPGYLYFPACFSEVEGSNVISVTGLSAINTPCAYQNYSGNFVRLGVLNSDVGTPRTHPCCSFHLSYLPDQVVMEGSSFATPVVAGKISSFIVNHGIQSIPNYFSGIAVLRSSVGAPSVTMIGQYIIY